MLRGLACVATVRGAIGASMADDLTSSLLGYPLKPRDIPASGFEQWCLTVTLSGGLVPVAFSREQALEIAGRIMGHYGGEVPKPRDYGYCRSCGGSEGLHMSSCPTVLYRPVCDARSTRTVDGGAVTWPKLP